MDRRSASRTEPVADPREALPAGTVRTTAAQEAAALSPHDSDGRLRGAASLPSEFQVGEEVIGQHQPLWARGSAVDEHDHDLLQIEIVEFSKLDPWLPKASSLIPLVALMALLHRRGFVARALQRPNGGPFDSIGFLRLWTRTTVDSRSGTIRTSTDTWRSPATSTGIPARSTIQPCSRWSATFSLRRRSMER